MPVSIHGNDYFTVAERLKLANEGTDPSRNIVKVITDVKQVGNLTIVHAMVTFEDGKSFTGMSLVNLQATSPAERDAPLETAETSAVGRALAFGGYLGSGEGIAGAEELVMAQQRSEARIRSFPDGSSSATRMGPVSAGGPSGAAPRYVGTPSPSGGGTPGGPSPAQVRFATKLWGEAGRPMPPPNFEAMQMREVSQLIDELKQGAPR